MSRDEAAQRQWYIKSIPSNLMPKHGKTCFQCHHWNAGKVPSRPDHSWLGRCEANAPQVIGGKFIPFPVTNCRDWCGQFMPGNHTHGRCTDCVWWRATGNGNHPGMGECRLSAPIIQTRPAADGEAWPVTHKSEGCAAHTAEDVF